MPSNKRFLKLIHTVQNMYREQVRKALEAQIQAWIDTGVVPRRPIADVLRRLHETAGMSNAMYVRGQVKRQVAKGFDNPSERIQWMINEYYRMYLLDQAVTPITETTKRQIQAVLEEANAGGWGADKTAAALKNSPITRMRAELIVRTETMRAANAGAMIGAIDMGILVDKKWISTQDIRTRRIPRDQYDHLHMMGKQVGFTEGFVIPSTKSIDMMQYPGDPDGSAGNVCNCRCTLAFVPVRDAQGRPIPITQQLPTDAPNRDYGQVKPLAMGNPFVELFLRATQTAINVSLINELIEGILAE